MTNLNSKIKTAIIIVLAGLTVYQTAVLWFFNITGHNFLLNTFMQQAPIPEGAYMLIVPKRVITSLDDGRFSALYSNLSESDPFVYGHMVLTEMLQTGRFATVHTAGLEEMMLSLSDVPLHIFEYAFPMDAEWFVHAFGERGNMLTRPGVRPFRYVIILFPLWEGAETTVFFLCENGYAYEFNVAFEGEFYHLTVETVEAEGAYYIFEEGEFVRDSHFYSVAINNPYADAHGVFSLSSIRERVSGFFSNPAAIRDIPTYDVWVYRDVNTVVRYYVTHVLEYISYRPIDRGMPTTFLDDYVVAVQFIERDHLVTNEMYLADFREENGSRIFYFNYVVNNMPITMPENWPENSPLTYPIVLTVDHGSVVRYRKVAFNFYATDYEGGLLWINFQG